MRCLIPGSILCFIATIVTTPFTSFAQRLKPADIKGVVIHMEYGYGVGGMITTEYRPYLLLNDGTIYKQIKESPYDLDVTTSRQSESTKWGSWKLDGKTLVVTLPQKNGAPKTDKWTKNWFWAKAATTGEKIKGSYKTIGGGGNTALGGNAMIVVATNISFNEKGQFTLEKTAGGSADATTTYAKKNTAGSYTLNGYSIEFKYNDGKVTNQLFYFYPDKRTTFGLGRSAYVPAN